MVLIAISVAVFRECQRQHVEKQRVQKQIQSILYTTVVSVPGPNGRFMFYRDVQVIEKGPAMIRFRTSTGEVIEQHGMYRIETISR